MEIRNKLDKCWAFVDTQHYGVFATADNNRNCSLSNIFYIRFNDIILLTSPKYWRHIKNLDSGAPPLLLISNNEIFLSEPGKYTRLTIEGTLSRFDIRDLKETKLLEYYQKNIPNDPKDTTYLCILQPKRICLTQYLNGKEMIGPIDFGLEMFEYDIEGRLILR
jgi:hypothetical protein